MNSNIASALGAATDRLRELGLGDAFEPRAAAAIGESGMGIAKQLRGRKHAFLVSALLPHFDDSFVLGVGAHQRRIGMKFLEIAGDRHGFAD